MATAAALKSIESLSGVDARMEALDRLERLTDEAAAEIVRHRSNLLLKRGIKAWRPAPLAHCLATNVPRQARIADPNRGGHIGRAIGRVVSELTHDSVE